MLPRQWFYFGLAFLGVYFIKGFDPTADIFGIIVVLLSAVFSAGVYLITPR